MTIPRTEEETLHRRMSAFSVPMFIVQCLTIPLFVLVIGFSFSLLAENVLSLHNNNVVTYTCYLGTGFAAGLKYRRTAVGSSEGKWIWIPMLFFLLWAFLSEPSHGRPRSELLPEFFLIGARNGFVAVLFTLPILGSCCYSIAIAVSPVVERALSRRRRTRRRNASVTIE